MLGRLFFALLALIGLAAVAAVGFYFFMKRGDIPYETLAAHYETANSHYVDLPGGVHLHYVQSGPDAAPALVLLHGYALSSASWNTWTERLHEDYRIYALDMPGHGLTRAPAGFAASMESLADVVEQFAASQQLAHFTLAGSSIGGNVAWEYALAHPERLNALVLVDAAGWKPEAPAKDQPLVFKLLQNPIARSLMRDLDNTNFLRQGLEASYANPALATDDMVARYAELSRGPGHRDILMQLAAGMSTKNFATPERLAALKTSTLILQGSEDQLVPQSFAEQFHQAIAGSRLVVLDGVGHLPHEEAPDQSVEALRAFLQSLRAPADAASMAAH